MHPDGYIELRDRAKDIIISGGENIASIEVEQALDSHPGGAGVRPWSASPTRSGARCRWRSSRSAPGATLTESELIGARPRTAGALQGAASSIVVGELPKTATGKIQKYVLREQARAQKPGAGGPG